MTEIEEAIAKGKCPNCGGSIKDHKPIFGQYSGKIICFQNCNIESMGYHCCEIKANSPLARAMGLVKK